MAACAGPRWCAFFVAALQAAQDGNVEQPFELKDGKGSDADTLGKPLVWVYDTKDFPSEVPVNPELGRMAQTVV